MKVEQIELNTPEGLRRGDKVVRRVASRGEITSTVRDVVFGLAYEGDTHRRIVVTFEEHLGVLCIPNIPLDQWGGAGFVRAYREVVKYDNEDEFTEAQERDYQERGELATLPDTLPCPDCTRLAGRDTHDDANMVHQAVIALGGVVEAHRDPTQTYKLACGHTVI